MTTPARRWGTPSSASRSSSNLSVTISHETLETIRDQDASGYRFAGDGIARADEACDAVEDRTYTINGVQVSDYVLPSWYVAGSKGPWDKLAALAAPLTRTDGGYVIELKNGVPATDPPQAAQKTAAKAHPKSRTSRRLAA